MLAPSFQSFQILSEPFDKNGRKYVRVKNPKTQTEREVRYYTDAEYDKAYGRKESNPKEKSKRFKNLWKALGFHRGYIYVFKDWDYTKQMYLESNARYHCGFGWYVVSEECVPTNLPRASILLREQAFTDKTGEEVKSDEELKKIIRKLP